MNATEWVQSAMEFGRPAKLIRAAFFALVASGFAAAWLLDGKLRVSGLGPTGNVILFVVVVLAALAAIASSLYDWKKQDASTRPVVVALRTNPSRIVWIYTVRIMRYQTHYDTEVYFCMDDGSHDMARVVSRDEAAFLEAVTRACPQATQGFSDELAARYRQNPASLRRPSS